MQSTSPLFSHFKMFSNQYFENSIQDLQHFYMFLDFFRKFQKSRLEHMFLNFNIFEFVHFPSMVYVGLT